MSEKPVIPIVPIADAGADTEQSLYEVRQKIYPRAVSGWFASWRWALVIFTQLIYYGLPWLSWNGRQAVLFDLAARKFYIFGIVFWPQDFIYLTVLLLISAFSLFLFTAVAGRLWCGYACPQTVYTEIFLWVERHIEGDRPARMKLDGQPFSARKLGKKATKHGIWIAIALWTGFTLVGYFTPITELGQSLIAFTAGPWEWFWLLFYGFATYGNAGWMREQVCKYMCPYARFQGVMFDRDTLLITYDQQRGEPRGARGRKVDPKSKGLGDCVDCNICVQVCPTGIDIRKGQQYECIGCAACIDGCNQVMEKMGYAPGLIRYATLNAVDQHYGWQTMIRRVFRPRVLIYTAILWSIIGVAAYSLWHRVPVKVDVIRDRTTLSREVAGGLIENVYRLQIMNTQERPQRLLVRANGLPGIAVYGQAMPLEIGPASSRLIPIAVRADAEGGQKGANRIEFQIVAVDAEGRELLEGFDIHEKAAFFKP
ncbi:MAG: cytochrome c oxidase accessory protein CcoG [Betaproteobacteria bacterium]|nr:cytochrome c oxidase accessory protein CcoG [Betaproteobacteria bacterium]